MSDAMASRRESSTSDPSTAVHYSPMSSVNTDRKAGSSPRSSTRVRLARRHREGFAILAHASRVITSSSRATVTRSARALTPWGLQDEHRDGTLLTWCTSGSLSFVLGTGTKFV